MHQSVRVHESAAHAVRGLWWSSQISGCSSLRLDRARQTHPEILVVQGLVS